MGELYVCVCVCVMSVCDICVVSGMCVGGYMWYVVCVCGIWYWGGWYMSLWYVCGSCVW